MSFGRRMRGSGNEADAIKQTFKMARKKCFGNPGKLDYNLELYDQTKKPQLKLF